MKAFLRPLSVLAVLLVAVMLASACGGDDNSHGMGSRDMMNSSAPAGSIRVDLTNWAGGPAQSEAKAGSVTFWAVHDMGHAHGGNEGGATHDLQVMRKGTGGNLELVGQVQGLTMGQAKVLTLNLSPGDYELSCNVVEQVAGKMVSHYQQGMVSTFKVTA